MKHPLTVCYITGRMDPRIDWFFDSLIPQIYENEPVEILVVDRFANIFNYVKDPPKAVPVRWAEPKPCVWQGRHRLTKDDWWAASNARNTAICLCKTPWIAFVDDRSVLQPGWLQQIRHAQDDGYAVCGGYQKRINMKVQGGLIIEKGEITGRDHRLQYAKEHRPGQVVFPCPGEWMYGANLAVPLEWALAVNGYEELMDGLSAEDVVFGMMLANNNFPICFNIHMRIVEDRTPSEIGEPLPRTSKERHPHDTLDKGHKALERFSHLKRTEHQWNLSEIREQVLAGGQFPIPTGPTHDWFDDQPLAEMEPPK